MEDEWEDRWDKVDLLADYFRKDLECYCYRIVGEGSGTHYMGHFEEVHTEQDCFVEVQRMGQRLGVHCRTKECVAVHIEEALEENHSVGHTTQEAGHIAAEPAGNLQVDRTVEDILGGHYKEVRRRRKDFEGSHMTVEGPENSH